MALLKIIYYGDPLLRTRCQEIDEITDEIRQLVDNMFETCVAVNGIGLAAPQVGRAIRLFITMVPHYLDEDTWEPGEKLVFINPKILSVSDEQWIRGEGCVSVPGVYGDVIRPCEVTVEATDLAGKRQKYTFSGLNARCVLHENDHINGKLFLDRLDKRERKLLEPQLRKLFK